MHRSIALAPALLATLWSGQAHAANVLETATLGPTGQSGGGGASVTATSWFGANFTLTQPARAVSVGAHLQATGGGSLFAAILPIDAETGLPSCLDLSCALTVALFTPTDPSSESIVPVDVMLPAGTYGVVFGAGSGGATGQAVAPLNDPMLGMPTFLGRVFFQGEFVWFPQMGQIDARFFLALADCGDGELDTGEGCDDGNGSDADACTTACQVASCGDGFVHDGVEECDPADPRGPACTNDCALEVEGTTTGEDTGSTSADPASTSDGSSSDSTSSTSEGASGTTGEEGDTNADPATSGTSSMVTGASETTAETGARGTGTGTDTEPEMSGDQDGSAGGCGCRSSGDASWGFVAMAFMGLMRRRRR